MVRANGAVSLGVVVLAIVALVGACEATPGTAKTKGQTAQGQDTHGQVGTVRSALSGFPNLQLRVRTDFCASRAVLDSFEITNAGTSPVNLSDITVKFWIDDTTGEELDVDTNDGCVATRGDGDDDDDDGDDEGDEHPRLHCHRDVDDVSGTAATFAPTCGPDPTHQANQEITLSTTDPGQLGPGEIWTHLGALVNLPHFDAFVPGAADWYSGCVAASPSFSPVYDTHFAVYVAGNLVTSSPGVPPSCRATTGSQPLPGETIPGLSSYPLVGPLDPTSNVTLLIGLPFQRQADLAAALAGVTDPTSPTYRQYMAPDVFASNFGPPRSDFDAVTGLAAANGLTVTSSSTALDVITVTGPAANVENTFFVTLNVYQRPDGTTFYAPANDPSVNLMTQLLYVSGFDSFPVPYPSSAACTNSTTLAPGFFGPDFRTNYACMATPGTNEGQGQTIALFEPDTYNSADITGYANGAGGAGGAITTSAGSLATVIQTSVKQVTHGASLPIGFTANPGFSAAHGQAEVEVGIEMALAMAPQATILVYEQNPTAAFNPDQLLTDLADPVPGTTTPPGIVANTWLWINGHPDAVAAQQLQKMAMQGQTFLQAAGDLGAYTAGEPVPNVPDPIIDSALMTVVGGTVLSPSASIPETTWNDPGIRNVNPATQATCAVRPFASPFQVPPPRTLPCDSATGGGLCSGYGTYPTLPLPSYQTGLLPGGARMIPDVSMAAENLVAFTCTGVNGNGPCTTGAQTCWAGTSASTALWAGYIALSNKTNTSFTGPIGFANPLLYGISSQFNDIKDSSDNDFNCNTSPCVSSSASTTYRAVNGYDMATGLGSPFTATCGLLSQLPPKACNNGTSLSLVQVGLNVAAFVPRGSWAEQTVGIDVVPIEAAPGVGLQAASTLSTGTQPPPPALPPANSVINTCAATFNGSIPQVVCSSNGTQVYVYNVNYVGSTLNTTGGALSFQDGADTTAHEQFSGGVCDTCNVIVDPVHNKAYVSIATTGDTGAMSTGAAFQPLDLSLVGSATNPFGSPIAVGQEATSEDTLVDPVRNLILSPNEGFDETGGATGNFQLVSTVPPNTVYNFSPTGGPTNPATGIVGFDSVAEDCTTGIAVVGTEFAGTLFLADLTQANLTAPPAWTDPASQFITIPEFTAAFNGFFKEAGLSTVAVASGTHVGVAAGEFGGATFAAFRLPAGSGSAFGTAPSFPVLVDYVVATIPTTPDPAASCTAITANRKPWAFGADPHTLTAYQSSNNGAPYAVFEDDVNINGTVDGTRTFLAVVDLNALLALGRGTGAFNGTTADAHQLASWNSTTNIDLDAATQTCCTPGASGVNPPGCIVRFVGGLN
jgi:hypothetical protein